MSPAIKFALIFILSTLTAVWGFAQSIRGTVTDSIGKPVPYATINLKNSSNLIIGYTISDSKGGYLLRVPANAVQTNLVIEVSCMGFKKQSKSITDLTLPVNFKLTTAVKITGPGYEPAEIL
jgi:hypothetical protein